MCTNGVNTGQFEQMIDQIDDHIKLERRWSHTLAHMAEDAVLPQTGAKLHEVQAALAKNKQEITVNFLAVLLQRR